MTLIVILLQKKKESTLFSSPLNSSPLTAKHVYFIYFLDKPLGFLYTLLCFQPLDQ